VVPKLAPAVHIWKVSKVLANKPDCSNHNFIKCLSQLTVQKLPGVLETHVRGERRLLREPLSTQGAFKLGFLSALVLYVAPQARIVFVGFLAEAAKKLIVEPHPKP
jgi:hypothetical protein